MAEYFISYRFNGEIYNKQISCFNPISSLDMIREIEKEIEGHSSPYATIINWQRFETPDVSEDENEQKS